MRWAAVGQGVKVAAAAVLALVSPASAGMEYGYEDADCN